ncbi:hypothetical protein [Lactobacillus johnsonii]|uniref:rolling circle replication-associated protein n=1 Tax=Lactobacillus johnsonii TaxID=33959 RepID=UPI003981A2B3
MKRTKKIDEESLVTAHVYGDTIEISTALGGIPVMKKLDKDRMLNIRTGEVVEVHHITSRADPKNYESLRSTFKRLKRLIGANFFGGRSELWVTLTYKHSPMTDPDKLYSDFKNYMARLRRKVNKKLIYIVVIEPQASGSLHAHCLMKTPDKSTLFVKNDEMRKIWGHGFVNVRRLKDSDNASAYLMAYLTDIDLNNLEGNFEDHNKEKKIIKGGRLGLYPVHMRIYRASRGVKQPLKLKDTKESIQKKYKLDGLMPDYYRKFEILKKEDLEPFEIETEYYSRKKAELKRAMAKVERKV